MLDRLTNRTTKLLRLDVSYILSGGTWLMLSRVVSGLVGLGLSVAFANLVDPSDFGLYQFILSTAILLGSFTLSEMPTAVNQSVARGYDRSLKDGFVAQLKWNVIPSVMAAGLAAYYFSQENSVLGTGFAIVALFTPLFLSAHLYGAQLEGKRQFKAASIGAMVRATLSAGSLVVLLYFFTTDPIMVVLTYFAVQTTINVLFFRYALTHNTDTTKEDPELLSYAKHLSLMNILNRAANHIDKILVFQFLGAANLAIYAFALGIPKQMLSLEKVISRLALPKLANRNISEIKNGMYRKAAVLAAVTLCIVVVYVIAAPYIFQVLFPTYIESVIYSQALMCLLLFMPITYIHQIFIAQKQIKSLYIVKTVKPIVKISLLLVLLPTIGIWGAVIALAATYFTHSILLLFLFRKM